MMLVEVPLSPRLCSEIHTDTSKELNISSPLKACTLVSLSMLEPRVSD